LASLKSGKIQNNVLYLETRQQIFPYIGQLVKPSRVAYWLGPLRLIVSAPCHYLLVQLQLLPQAKAIPKDVLW
jgi:hypothetical protein